MFKLKSAVIARLISWGGDFVFQRVYEYLIVLILERLRDYGDCIDWSLVRKDAYERIRKVVPTELLEEVVISIAGIILNRVESAFDKALDCQEFQTLLIQGEFKKVAKIIRKYLIQGV